LTAEDERHERGRAVYNFRCYFCHGYSGDARTLAASFLTPPPRSFVATRPEDLSRKTMITVVTYGQPDTAMQGFTRALSGEEIGLVVDFVRREFMQAGASNTRYHTVENGWPNHDQYAPAFPFALGELFIDTPDDRLSPAQRAGKRLFMHSCVTCHDRGTVQDEGVIWDPRPVSYPRSGYSHRTAEQRIAVDTETAASPYARHDVRPETANLTTEERRGEELFQANCAFCHAADGTGLNWIGSFLEPHPRNLTDSEFMVGMTRQRLAKVIGEGLTGTTMPAWKDVLDAGQIAAVIAYISRVFYPVADTVPSGEPVVD
jgi:cytochrome c oxidase cbb3-type subunit 3